MRPNYSHYSRENATPSSGTSPITCCKREPPPPPGGIFYGSADQRQRRANVEFVLERIHLTLSEWGNVKTCMLNFSNKWLIFLLSFHAMFITEFCFVRLPQMAVIKKYPASTHFQYSSAKFILFWFWLQPITMRETGIQKCLWLEQFIGI